MRSMTFEELYQQPDGVVFLFTSHENSIDMLAVKGESRVLDGEREFEYFKLNQPVVQLTDGETQDFQHDDVVIEGQHPMCDDGSHCQVFDTPDLVNLIAVLTSARGAVPL